MNIRLDQFFQNPNLLSLIAIIAVVAGYTISVYIQHRSRKKVQAGNTKNSNSQVSALQALTHKITILIDKEINTVNTAAAETIIESTLRRSEALIKDEIRRVFEFNHRDKFDRKKLIKKAIASKTFTIYNEDMNALSRLFYKEKPLSEFLINIDANAFFDDLIKLLFTVTENKELDLGDCLNYVETQMNSYITKAKAYYSNL